MVPAVVCVKEEKDKVGGLDPYVARVLSQEPVDVQRTVIDILGISKDFAKGWREQC